MYQSQGYHWNISADTSAHLLTALYLRDAAGLGRAGEPAVCEARPPVRAADVQQLVQHDGGLHGLRIEWEQWWARLVLEDPELADTLSPPSFPAFSGSPALRRLLQAHYGAALSWTQDRWAEYEQLDRRYHADGARALLEELVLDRELELGRNAHPFSLRILELPLAEPRAWFVEPDRMLMCVRLPQQEELYRSYLEPVLRLLV